MVGPLFGSGLHYQLNSPNSSFLRGGRGSLLAPLFSHNLQYTVKCACKEILSEMKWYEIDLQEKVMEVVRRSFLQRLIGLVAAPSIIRTTGLIMPIKPLLHTWKGGAIVEIATLAWSQHFQ